MPELCGILLAAGQSVRFGNNKLLQSLPDGTPLIAQAVRNMRTVLEKVVVVVPPQHAVLSDALESQAVELIVNAKASEGMGSSLACGIAACREVNGWVIGLADMPWIQPATINQVALALREGRSLVAPRYQDQRGHPVGFQHRFGTELVKLHGDKGARTIVEQHATELHLIDVDDPGILLDVDTPADLTRANAFNQ
jgi:molybdenum cofactor cytidylyltransferase